MIALSVVLAALSAVLGHVGALTVPAWFGYQSTTTAGMMAVAAGLILLVAASFGPRHGVLVKFVRQRMLAWRILADDVVGLLYRVEERAADMARFDNLREALLADRFTLALVLLTLRLRSLVTHADGRYRLTETGRARAQQLVRSHRLWESYLVEHAGLPPEQVHEPAERTEHYIGQRLQEQLAEELTDAATDPHGRDIP